MSIFREQIKAWVPPSLLYAAKMRAQRHRVRSSRAAQRFSGAGEGPAWLGGEDLKQMNEGLPDRDEDQIAAQYTEIALLKRARERADMIRRILGRDFVRCHDIIETGAADAMVALMLNRMGKNTLATDIQDGSYLSNEASKEGVPFRKCDACAMPFSDGAFDLLYSFDSFEHFQDPERALQEAARVVRPGGFVYLRFGPLYYSPEGMHLGSRLNVPYASVLYRKETIDEYMLQSGRDPINHEYCNEWTLEQYRALFERNEDTLKKKRYFEHWDLSGLDLIESYPACFKNKSDDLESFLVGVVDALFVKK